MERTIPHLYYPQASIDGGIAKIKDLTTYNHPLEEALQTYPAQKAAEKKNFLRVTQGLHAAMRLNMENTILSQYRRLPGFHSEFLGLEVMDTSNERIGFEDFLNDPRERPEPPMDLHMGMERMLGLAPVEPFHTQVSHFKP